MAAGKGQQGEGEGGKLRRGRRKKTERIELSRVADALQRGKRERKFSTRELWRIGADEFLLHFI